MDIQSVSNNSYSRPVTPSSSGSGRNTYEDSQASAEKNRAQEQAALKAQERARQQRDLQQNVEQRNAETQRRLDGRLISLGQQTRTEISQQQQQANQVAQNRERINQAYTPPPRNNLTNAHKQNHEASNDDSNSAIDIVV